MNWKRLLNIRGNKAGPLSCIYCSSIISNHVQYLGQTITCPHCHAVLEAPDRSRWAMFDNLLNVAILLIILSVVGAVLLRVFNP